MPSENKPRYRLTKLGEQMARLPIDPKISRMLLAAKKHDCVQEMLVIVSALSVQDPRERPLEAREAAAKAHERFTDKQSDFLAYLNIWDSFQREREKGLSNRQLVQWCRQHFLSHLRMREWRELHKQLADIAVEMGLIDKERAFRRPLPPAPQVSDGLQGSLKTDADLSARLKQKQLDKKHARTERRAAKEAGYEQIHRALLTGLIANVGMKSPDGHDYIGARGAHFHLFPASALFKSKPKWVMAAELTETTRLYARDVAAIQPEWIEQEAPHLVKYHYFEPHWEQKRGEVVAAERVTLYGLTVLPRRPVAYARVAPEEAREIFIRSALVAQECDLKAGFFVHNKKLIKEVGELEHKSRRQDVLVDEEALFDFYNQRLPQFYEPSETFSGSPNKQRQPENSKTPSETAKPATRAVPSPAQAQERGQAVGRMLESDKTAEAKATSDSNANALSDTSIRPTASVSDGLSGSLKGQRPSENAGHNVGRILESDKTAEAKTTSDSSANVLSDTSIRPTASVSDGLSGSLKGQRPSENAGHNVGRILESDKTAEAKATSDSNANALSDTSIRPTASVSDGLSGSLKPHIRPAADSDAAAVAALFRRAVMHIPNSDYSEAEKNAWLHGADNAAFWQKRIGRGHICVATHNGCVSGFVEYLPEQAHIDCLFTDPRHQRQGIASALLAAVLPSADSGKAVSADVSKAASAFFQKQGFVLQHENEIPRNGLVLTNYRMVRQTNQAQKQPENAAHNVGRILESDKTAEAKTTSDSSANVLSDTSIRPTASVSDGLSGSLKGQRPSENAAHNVGRMPESDKTKTANVSGNAVPARPKGSLKTAKPVPIADIRTFQSWLKTAEHANPRLLFLTREDLMQHAAAHITEEQFPKHWQSADGKFKLAYRFEPHHPLDGVTLTLPLTVLNRVAAPALEWLVPGMLREKIQLLIKALPKQIRRICVPVPEFTTRFLSSNPNRQEPIIPQLARFIAKTAGDMRLLEQINQDEWSAFRLPEHCYFNLRIIDDGGQELAMGRDLAKLQQELGQAAAVTFRDNTQEFERDNVTAWDIGTLPESIKFARGKQQLNGYLGLQKEKDGRIALRLSDTPEAAAAAHRQGLTALMQLQLKEHMKDLNKGIQGFTQAAMLLKHIPADTLRDDLTAAICDRAFIGDDEPPRSEKAFKEQIKRARSRLPAVKEALSRYLQETAAAYAELNAKLGKHPLTPLIRKRLDTLLGAGFATRTPWAQWSRLPVYIKAMSLRLDKYSANPARDTAREADIQELEQMWQEKADTLAKQNQPLSDGLKAFKWQIEELRVSLFAQELKTPYPVSVKRLLKEWEGLDKG
ncbi:ATP-dependent RNA helicase HrpA [Kingella potus]|uniref:ATP-dependent RNA helicase HrpA n=4 Tax=Kingella potus TaxID=265175 RepID=A0A377R3D2_9NEIS|nr:ATP-dependent RNA helicase HrpA [Kingella potus]